MLALAFACLFFGAGGFFGGRTCFCVVTALLFFGINSVLRYAGHFLWVLALHIMNISDHVIHIRHTVILFVASSRTSVSSSDLTVDTGVLFFRRDYEWLFGVFCRRDE